MTMETAELLRQALTLSAAERTAMAESLLESLEGTPEDTQSVEATWSEEIARRIDDLDSGKVRPLSLEEFRRQLASATE